MEYHQFNYRLYILFQSHVITQSQPEIIISDGFVNINWKSQESNRVQLGISQWHIQDFPGGQPQRGGTNLLFLGQLFLKIA